VEGSGWVQPQAPAAAPGPAWGQAPPQPAAPAGWVQPQAQAPAPPAGWAQPPAQPAAPAAWVQPPQAPAAAPGGGWAQPQPTPGWVQPIAAKGSVTILARIAGLFLVLLGLLWGAIGAVLIVGGTAFHAFTDQFSALNSQTSLTTTGNVVGGVIAGVGIVILVFAIFEVLGGIGALFGKTWGRILGILYSLVFGAFLLVAVTSGTQAADVSGNSGVGTGVIFIVVMFLMYLYALVVLLLRWRGHARA
jgi:hypothetical protein